MDYTPASPGRFTRALESFTAENPEYDPFITTDRDFTSCRCYLDSWGESGYAITEDKEIVALFNGREESLGDQLVFSALKNGGRWLNCFEGFLGSFYFQHGVRTVATMPFDTDKAPEGWDYEQYGEPDVLFMAFNPKNVEVEEVWSWDRAVSRTTTFMRDP